jgi:hypothetical protein
MGTDGQTDMTKPTVTFCNSVNAPKNNNDELGKTKKKPISRAYFSVCLKVPRKCKTKRNKVDGSY